MSDLELKVEKLIKDQILITESEAQDLAYLICELPEIKGGRVGAEVIENLAEVDLFLRESDEFKKDKLIGGADVYYTKDKKKAVIINFYGNHYRIRYSNKINRHWVRIDEHIINKIGDSTMNEATGMPQVNFYVYVTESCKDDAPYPNHERETIHEIGINEILPAMNIYKSLESSIKEVYDDELKTNPVITGYKITKILLALDKYCSVEPNSL